MRLLRDITLDNYRYHNDGTIRKIFSVGYEGLKTLIFYQDGRNVFKLVVAREDDPPIVIEKDITRAEAFRLMNTRP